MRQIWTERGLKEIIGWEEKDTTSQSVGWMNTVADFYGNEYTHQYSSVINI